MREAATEILQLRVGMSVHPTSWKWSGMLRGIEVHDETMGRGYKGGSLAGWDRPIMTTKRERTTMPHTVHLHRVLTARPEKVYRAFLESDALAKWIPPDGFACTVHHLEPKVGGTFKASFRNFTTGDSHTFGGEYTELVPNERLRYGEEFEDPNMPGHVQVTITLKAVAVGTDLTIVQEGLPDVVPSEACYLGWQQSLQNLARLVEPEIK